MLPFSHEQFVAVFAAYDLAVWPAQLVAYLLALAVVAALLRPSRGGSRVIGAALALMWVWTGIAYHATFFSAINRAAWLFALLFVMQGVLLGHAALRRPSLAFACVRGGAAWCGWGLLFYATVLYPLLGLWAGQRYPGLPMFGITPCPLTLFTFGVLLLAAPPLPCRLLVIPFVWSLIGGSAAWLLQVPQDWPLLLAGVTVAPALAWRDRQPQERM
jgi:hypothetical protein